MVIILIYLKLVSSKSESIRWFFFVAWLGLVWYQICVWFFFSSFYCWLKTHIFFLHSFRFPFGLITTLAMFGKLQPTNQRNQLWTITMQIKFCSDVVVYQINISFDQFVFTTWDLFVIYCCLILLLLLLLLLKWTAQY